MHKRHSLKSLKEKKKEFKIYVRLQYYECFYIHEIYFKWQSFKTHLLNARTGVVYYLIINDFGNAISCVSSNFEYCVCKFVEYLNDVESILGIFYFTNRTEKCVSIYNVKSIDMWAWLAVDIVCIEISFSLFNLSISVTMEPWAPFKKLWWFSWFWYG